MQETESPVQGEAKAKICRADSSLSGFHDSSPGEGAGLAKAAGLLGLDEDALARKVAPSWGIGITVLLTYLVPPVGLLQSGCCRDFSPTICDEHGRGKQHQCLEANGDEKNA